MDEVKETYLEESQEKQIIARTGRSRTSSGMVFDVRAAEKKNGPVVVKQLPDLPTVRDRLLYITQGLTQKEIGKRIGVSSVSVCQHLNPRNTPQETTVKKYADAFGVPLDWLRGNERKPDEEPAPEMAPKPSGTKARIRMSGTFRGDDLPALLPCLPGEYQVSIEVVQA